MKRLLILLGVLIIAVAIGISVYRYPGVIIVAFWPWRIDIPLWLGIVGFIVLYLTFHYVVVLFKAIFRAARSLAHFGKHYRKHRAKALARKGFVALTEGDYALAEKALEQSAEDSEFPWFNYLSAAKASAALGDDNKAARYLARAEALAPESTTAIALTKAQVQFDRGHYQQVINTLLPIYEKEPHHTLVLSLLQESYYASEDWEGLSQLLPKLKKYHVMSKVKFEHLEEDIWKKRLTSFKKASIVDQQALWEAMPHHLHTDPALALYYARLLMKYNQDVEAELVLRDSIKHHWNDALVRCYGELSHPYPEKLLNIAEGWLPLHTQSAALLLTLGRLCAKQKLWGKAQRYFEASLSLAADPSAYAELAYLLEKLNKPELGAQYYKKGLLLLASTGLSE